MKRSRVVVAAVLAGAIAIAAAKDGGAPPTPPPDPLAVAVAAGRSWRLETANGPVHVWVPAGYHADGAATVLYVHGYYTDIDQAWVNHRLPQQFALSGLNAVFIAPEAPKGARQKVHWPSLADLLVEVQRATGVTRPMGATVAIGHSGAYRVLLAWMDYPPLEHVIAMDAMYGEVEAWSDWVAASPAHRLIQIGDDTVRWTEELAAAAAADGARVVTIDRFPDDPSALPAEAADAQVLYIRSQLGHMPLVNAGLGLPFVLRLVPAEILPDAPWRAPLALPPIDAGLPDSVGP